MKYRLAALTAALLLAVVAAAGTQEQKQEEGTVMLKSVVHVNFGDSDRHEHALGNIENILKDAPTAELEVVCHGEGLRLVEKKQTQYAEKVQALLKRGVRFVACENTMKKKAVTVNELVANVTTVPSGAVEVISKQQQGYSYFRP
ncbi:MAG: DsrE family protein [Pirellulaceae bacterium]